MLNIIGVIILLLVVIVCTIVCGMVWAISKLDDEEIERMLKEEEEECKLWLH